MPNVLYMLNVLKLLKVLKRKKCIKFKCLSFTSVFCVPCFKNVKIGMSFLPPLWAAPLAAILCSSRDRCILKQQLRIVQGPLRPQAVFTSRLYLTAVFCKCICLDKYIYFRPSIFGLIDLFWGLIWGSKLFLGQN